MGLLMPIGLRTSAGLPPPHRPRAKLGAVLAALLAAAIVAAVWSGVVEVQEQAQAQTPAKEQSPQPQLQPPPAQLQPPPAQLQPASAQLQPSSEWARLPRMQLERQYAGPLQDTIVQRWRDAVDGTTCYIYLPITAAHSPPVANGFVQYGGNTIGSISCFMTPAAPPMGKSASRSNTKSVASTP
jgi:hypothetical protein